MGVDKEWERGGAFDRQPDGCHLDSRPRKEEILEVECPKCGAPPMAWCDRRGDAGYRRTAHGMRMIAEGTPDSHQVRKWARQGHGPEMFAELRAREVAGLLAAKDGNTDMGEISLVIAGVRCPVHGADRGTECPGDPGVCRPRVRKWMRARDQKITRAKQRQAAARRKEQAA